MAEISKQKKVADRFIISSFRNDIAGAAFLFVSLILFAKLPYDAKTRSFYSLAVVALGFIIIVSKPDFYIKRYLGFNKRLKNISYFDNKMKSFIPVKKIAYDTVFLNNSKLAAIVKVKPFDLSILDEQMQDLIVDLYRMFLRSLDTSIQIISRSVPVSLDIWGENQERKIMDSSWDNSKERIDTFKRHKSWIEDVIRHNKSRDRVFYLVITQKPVCAQQVHDPNAKNPQTNPGFSALFDKLLSFIGIQSSLSSSLKEQQAIQELSSKVELCMSRLGQTKVELERLKTDELIVLFSTIFSDIKGYNTSYTSPIMWEDDNYAKT